MGEKHTCRDFGRPGCLEVADEKFTMCFDDIGEPPIHWCSVCGSIAQQQLDVLAEAFSSRGEVFIKELEAAVTEAETTSKASRN